MSAVTPPTGAPFEVSDTDPGASTTGRLARTRAYRPWVPTPDERRPIAVDLIASALLAVCAVDAFDPAFGGGLWWSVGFVGIVAGLLLAFVTIQFRFSPLTTVITTVVGFFLLGGHAVADTAVAVVLPGPGTPAALFDGITHGWARLLTTVAPVGTVDNLPAIIYLAGFVAAGGALHLARRTKSIWLPLVPPVAAMVAGILVGTHTPASTVLQGAALALVALVWLSLRGARNRPRVHVVGTNRLTRRATGVVFAALIVAGGLLVEQVQPVAGPEQRSVLRDRTQPPFDPNDYPSPLAGYPAWRIAHKKATDDKKPDAPVLKVHGLPEGVPLRVAVMDRYDGTVWSVGGSSNDDDTSGSGRFVRVGSDLATAGKDQAGQSIRTRGPNRSVNVTVTLEGYRDVWVPTLDGVRTLEFLGSDAPELAAAVRYNKVSDTAAVPTGVTKGVRIEQHATVAEAGYLGPGPDRNALVGNAPVDPAVNLPPIDAGSTGSSDEAADGEGATKATQQVSLASVANELTGAAQSPYQQAVALESALRKKGQGYFADGLDDKSGNALAVFRSGHNLYQLGRFLNATNPKDPTKHIFVGNAERYSAAMAGMARAIGLPARVVVGFRADADDQHRVTPVNGTMIFTANQADAWVEIAFAGVGWVAFYPTPPRSQHEIPPQKPRQASAKTADVQAQPPVSPPPNPANLQDTIKTDRHEAKAPATPFHIPAWVWLLAKIIFYPLVVIAAVVGGITGYKRWRRNRRRTRGSPVDRITGAWAEVLDQLRDLGAKVPRSGTRLEIAGGVTDASWDQLGGFAAGVNAAMFGPDDPDDESVDSMWDWVESERSGMLAGLGRKRRWRAKLNLASVWPWR